MKYVWLLIPLCSCLLLGSDRRPSDPVTIPARRTTERPNRNVYNSSITIEKDGESPIVINVQLESVLYIEGKQCEFTLRLWEIDKTLATKKITVSW